MQPTGAAELGGLGALSLALAAAGSVGTGASPRLRLRKLASQPGLLYVPFRYKCNKANYGRARQVLTFLCVILKNIPWC